MKRVARLRVVGKSLIGTTLSRSALPEQEMITGRWRGRLVLRKGDGRLIGTGYR